MRKTTKLIVSNSLVTLLVVLIFALFSLNNFYVDTLREEHNDLEKCIQTFWELLGHNDHEFRLSGGRLLAGDHVINGNFEVPDKVQKIFGGVATVFMGDVRVSTNVLDDAGKRAVGTRLVGPAYIAIFKEGRPYRGAAFILGHPYLTAYDPIRDKNGVIIGALFVGVKRSSFQQHFNQLSSPIIVMLTVLLTSLAIVNFLLLRKIRKLENAEAKNLNFLRTLMDTIPSPIFYKDTSGRYLGCNKAYELYVGLSQDELIGNTVHELWLKELADKYWQQDQVLFENPGMQLYEASVVHADSTLRDVVFNKATFLGSDDSVAGLVGVILDITERKVAEEKIINAYHQMLNIVEFLPDATFVVDMDKRVIAWNKAMETMSGVGKAEILGKGDYEYALPFYGVRRPILIDFLDKDDDELNYIYLYVQKEERTLYAQFVLPPMNDRDARFVSSTASPLFDNQGNQVGSIQSIRDLTENRRVQKENTRLEVKLQHTELMQSVLTQLGHDLKTPLTPLLTLLPLFSKQVNEQRLKRLIAICYENANHINALTDKALKFASLSAMLTSVDRKEIVLATALNALLAGSFGDASCEHTIGTDIVVQAERDQLNELFDNLISNAVRYSPVQGVVRITAEQTEAFVTVAVHDDGTGLAPEHLERIFDEFYKVDKSRHDIAKLGLGLSICKRIVLNHQGKIWAESPGIGQGTTILFSLPRNRV